MSKLFSTVKVVGIISVVALAGILAAWLGSRRVIPASLNPDLERSSGESAHAVSVLEHENSKTVTAAAEPNPGLVSTSTPPGEVLTNWEDKVEEILSSEDADTDKASLLLAFFSRLPDDGQAEVAQHLSNLLPDADYAALGQYLTNSTTSEQVRDVLMGGLLNRPNGVKLPWLLEVARDDQNSKSDQARDLLRIFLEEDNGTDWAKWQTNLDQWLKDNPD